MVVLPMDITVRLGIITVKFTQKAVDCRLNLGSTVNRDPKRQSLEQHADNE